MRKSVLILILIIMATSCLIYLPYDENRPVRPSREEPYEPPDQYQAYGEISISFIYDYLGRFGFWVDYPAYGFVWIPRGVGHGWRPYTHGRWVWTDYGWTWMSNFEWGWIPFHYGRWGWDRHLGWFWAPDVIWAPAWVVWRIGDFYLGWAPLPPEVEFVVGYGLRWRIKEIPDHYWIFIEGRRFHEERLPNWILPPERNMTITNFTVVRDKISIRDRQMIINDGISPREIERITRKPVTTVKLTEVNKPEEMRLEIDELRLYKPTIKSDGTTPKAVLKREEAQEKISSIVEIKRPEEIAGVHRQEKSLLEKTQKMEIERLRKQTEEEAQASPPQEKQKKISELQVKLEELKKKHEAEKRELLKRQSEEKEVVKKGSLKKKSETEKY